MNIYLVSWIWKSFEVRLARVTNTSSNCSDDTRFLSIAGATLVWEKLQPVVSIYQICNWWGQNWWQLHLREVIDFKLHLAEWCLSRFACCVFGNLAGHISAKKASMHVSSPPEKKHSQFNMEYGQNWLIVTVERTTNILHHNFVTDSTIFMKHGLLCSELHT